MYQLTKETKMFDLITIDALIGAIAMAAFIGHILYKALIEEAK